MTGAKRPNIFRFIDGLKKDEDIARAKMITCNTAQKPKSRKPRDAQQYEAVKNSVLTYLRKSDEATKKAAEKVDEMDDEDSDDEQQQPSNQWSRSKTEREEWLKCPAMMLLSAIATNRMASMYIMLF